MTKKFRLSAVPFLALAVALCVPVGAQTAKTTPGGFSYSAQKVIYRTNGVRLQGNPSQPARIKSPQIDVAAPAIAFDLQGSGIKEVRAVGGVSLKLNLSSKNGGPPARIEATSTNATLVPAERKLILTGKLNGFYQIQGGAKNTLKGDTATLSYLNQNLAVNLEGGVEGVTVTVPAEAGDKPGAIGSVTVTARKVTFDGATGVGRFTGNARAVSNDGPNKFDVVAPEFLLTRGASGTISELTTVGHTVVKVDMPPEPAAAGARPAGTGPQLGAPTHVEATADSAVVNRDTSTIVFKGNVKGFYRLKGADGATADYNFAGDTATFKHSPTVNGDLEAGLNVEVVGKPVTVEAPGFDLGM